MRPIVGTVVETELTAVPRLLIVRDGDACDGPIPLPYERSVADAEE